MRRILWTILLFAIYIWVMSSGHDRMLIQQGKQIYQFLVSWFDDAEIDYQVHSSKPKEKKKLKRRWD